MMSLQFDTKDETDQFTFCRYGYHCNRASYFIVTDGRINDTIFHRLRNFDGTPNTVMPHLFNEILTYMCLCTSVPEILMTSYFSLIVPQKPCPKISG